MNLNKRPRETINGAIAMNRGEDVINISSLKESVVYDGGYSATHRVIRYIKFTFFFRSFPIAFENDN